MNDANTTAETPAEPRVPSSAPAGTKLQGLNYEKNKPDLFALEDHEYPAWLWGLIDDGGKAIDAKDGVVDVSGEFIALLLYSLFFFKAIYSLLIISA